MQPQPSYVSRVPPCGTLALFATIRQALPRVSKSWSALDQEPPHPMPQRLVSYSLVLFLLPIPYSLVSTSVRYTDP